MAAPVRHYLTYQHNVQGYFKEHRDKYQGVIIPISIATAFPSGTYGFVRALCARSKDKQYALDPRTPLFQKAWNRGNVREPHKRMANAMGSPFTTKGLVSRLEPSDFQKPTVVASVTKSCLEFQLGFRTRQEDARKLAKYKKLLGLTEMAELGDPQFLIPPYFQFDSLENAWYEVSLKCIEEAKKYSGNIPIRPVIHFQGWSSVADWTEVCGKLTENDVSAFWLYPNLFREHDAEPAELKSYRNAVQSARRVDLTPFSLFGGYFAILLFYSGLSGFSNGIGYGEWRDSGYHRGGTAENRIYILKLHRYLDPPLAQALIDKDPEYFANDTELLADCVASKRALTALSQAACLDHFIECRKLELDFVTSNPVQAAVDELEETLGRLEKVGPLERQNYGTSLQRWRDAIQ